MDLDSLEAKIQAAIQASATARSGSRAGASSRGLSSPSHRPASTSSSNVLLSPGGTRRTSEAATPNSFVSDTNYGSTTQETSAAPLPATSSNQVAPVAAPVGGLPRAPSMQPAAMWVEAQDREPVREPVIALPATHRREPSLPKPLPHEIEQSTETAERQDSADDSREEDNVVLVNVPSNVVAAPVSPTAPPSFDAPSFTEDSDHDDYRTVPAYEPQREPSPEEQVATVPVPIAAAAPATPKRKTSNASLVSTRTATSNHPEAGRKSVTTPSSRAPSVTRPMSAKSTTSTALTRPSIGATSRLSVSRPAAVQAPRAPSAMSSRRPSISGAGVTTPRPPSRASIATPTAQGRSVSRNRAYDNVQSRFMQSAVVASQKMVANRDAPANRAASLPPPPPAQYIPGQGHSREWVDITNKSAADLASHVDATAVAVNLGWMATDGEQTVISPIGHKKAAAMPATKLNAALELTAPPAVASPARAQSVSRSNTAMFGSGTIARHPIRRSSKTADMEAAIEMARAEAFGLVVGQGVRMTKEQAADVSARMYARAQESREKAAAAATARSENCTFAPAISGRASNSRITYAVANLSSTARGRASISSKTGGRKTPSPNGDSTALPRHEYLFANAAALAAKRARALERASTFDAACTFTPEITDKARAIVASSSEFPTAAGERLYGLSKTIEEKKAALAVTVLQKEATFRPELNRRSLASAQPAKVYQPKTVLDVEQLQAAAELKDCTFKPQLSARTSRVRSQDPVPVHERLLRHGRDAADRVKERRTSVAQQEIAGFTFKPTLNEHSERLASFSMRNSMEASARLYEDAGAIRVRLEEKKAELERRMAKNYTFKPSIDENSRSLFNSARRPGSTTSMLESEIPVWERLYDDARVFEDQRARAIAEAVEAELMSLHFTPAISERSRQIAAAADRVLAVLAQQRPDASPSSARRAAVWDRLYAQALTEPELRALREEMGRRIELRDCTFNPRTLIPRATPIQAELEADGHGSARESARGPGSGRRDVWSQLASEHKDVEKLEEIKARLELSQCTFAPKTNNSEGGLHATSSARSLSRSGSPGGQYVTAFGHPQLEQPPKPADAWERIIAEVQAESQAGLKNTTLEREREIQEAKRTRSPSRGSSPAVYERLYQVGVERLSPALHAEREAIKTSIEMEGCTFAPSVELSQSTVAPNDHNESAVHERLYQQAKAQDQALRNSQLVADEEARALSTLATGDPAHREAMRALEADLAKRSKGLLPAASSLSLSSSAAIATSLGLTSATSFRYPTRQSPSHGAAGDSSPHRAPIAVKSVTVLGNEQQPRADEASVAAAGYL